MKMVDRGLIDPTWTAIPLAVDWGRQSKELSLTIDPSSPIIRHWIHIQETDPVPAWAFFRESPPGSEWDDVPEAPAFVFRGRLIGIPGGQLSAVPRRRVELLLRIKKYVLSKERELRRLNHDVKALEAVADNERPTRTPIPSATRMFVFERDGGRCVTCGATTDLQFDHIIPFSKGGGASAENIQILCGPCNLQKSDHIA